MRGCRPLTTTEVHEVCSSFTGRYARRDRALFVLGCVSGLRVSELLSIKVGDVLEPTGRLVDRVYIQRQHVKGKHEGRSVLLHAAARDALTDWLVELEGRGLAEPDYYIFQSQKGCRRPMSVVQTWRILKDAYAEARVSGRTGTHSMRKSFAAAVFDGLGRDLLLAQQALGHRNVNSTISYLNVDQERIDAAVMAVPV